MQHNIGEIEDLLRKKFSSVGVILNIRIPAKKRRFQVWRPRGSEKPDPKKDRHQGYAFVKFKKAKSAEYAVRHHNNKPLYKGSDAVITVDLAQRAEYLALVEKIREIAKRKEEMQKMKEGQDGSTLDNGKSKSGEIEEGDEDEDEFDSDEEEFDLSKYDDIDLGDDFKIRNDLDHDFDEDGEDGDGEEEEDENDHESDKEDQKSEMKPKKGIVICSVAVAAVVQSKQFAFWHKSVHDNTEMIKDVRNTLFISNLAFDVDYNELYSLYVCYCFNISHLDGTLTTIN